ncbi:hypothetical protein FRB96_000706 [Tulasnella sp. 330]|nr:hypothetical protein FRB96_000706 [Tulasnella sp. 330]KAG8882974.1 hypothetical protein FRB97_007461 [Tulasnella sp. 331]KAG8887157.1 hypothetical protein FRB98_000413 [Tulasnella sp. 332]
MHTPVCQIKGNASDAQKALLDTQIAALNLPGFYGHAIMDRVKIVEVGVVTDEGVKDKETTIRVEFETQVELDMCNPSGNLHGGCAAYLAAVTTSVVYCLYDDSKYISMTLDTIFHAAGPVGSNIRIICMLVAIGGRISTSRCEIWGKENGRLVASASHLKLNLTPKTKKPKAKGKL